MEFSTGCGGIIMVPFSAQEHLRAHPEVSELLAEAIGRLSLPSGGQFLAIEVEMGRVIGRSNCVSTEPINSNELVTFASRTGRERASRVIVGVEGPETTRVSVLAFASKEDERKYVLITSFVGELAPKEPWDRSLISGSAEHQESLDFWCRHALIHQPEIMDDVFESTWDEVLK